MAVQHLDGCTPEPLMGYLKALGVLRIVAEQADDGVRGGWSDGVFVLESNHDRIGLVDFFLEGYAPTPIIAPWAGGSGFFGADNRVALDMISGSESSRLTGFGTVIVQVRETLKKLGLKNKPTPEEKEGLLRRYRREMPDIFVEWMDAALVLQKAGQSFPPLLGTGGNDGRLDFTQNYMQRLVSLGFAGKALVPGAKDWLHQSIFAEPARDLISAAVGQYDPGKAGGPNATMGMEGNALVNPWDYILMLEGALILAGAATRRLGVGQHDRAAFPFTVRPSAVGYGSEADVEESDSRGEMWLPLWRARASLGETRLMFAEGRAETNGRQSRDAVDFARAASSLGTDRGIDAFVRYGFLKRSGKSFVAAPLGTFPVRTQRASDLLREADPWLDALRWSSSGDDVPSRFRVARHRVETSIFDYCRYAQSEDDASWFQLVISALGAAERELAVGDAPPDKRRVRRPFGGLSSEWLVVGDDGSREFRLARSLAFLIGDRDKTGPIRRYMEPVEWEQGAWRWSERGTHVVWSGGDIARNLGAILVRRLMDADKAGETPLPLDSLFPASLADVTAFAYGQIDDQKLLDLLWGLVLVSAKGAAHTPSGPDDASLLPRAYALLKLTLLPGRLQWEGRKLRLSQPTDESDIGIAVKPEPAVFGRLRAGDVRGACEIAGRRLRASGLLPLASQIGDGSRRDVEWSAGGVSPARLLGSLLFPIPSQSVKALADVVLRRPKVETSA
jgi:CRISPR-associated protein Csx17